MSTETLNLASRQGSRWIETQIPNALILRVLCLPDQPRSLQPLKHRVKAPVRNPDNPHGLGDRKGPFKLEMDEQTSLWCKKPDPLLSKKLRVKLQQVAPATLFAIRKRRPANKFVRKCLRTADVVVPTACFLRST